MNITEEGLDMEKTISKVSRFKKDEAVNLERLEWLRQEVNSNSFSNLPNEQKELKYFEIDTTVRYLELLKKIINRLENEH